VYSLTHLITRWDLRCDTGRPPPGACVSLVRSDSSHLRGVVAVDTVGFLSLLRRFRPARVCVRARAMPPAFAEQKRPRVHRQRDAFEARRSDVEATRSDTTRGRGGLRGGRGPRPFFHVAPSFSSFALLRAARYAPPDAPTFRPSRAASGDFTNVRYGTRDDRSECCSKNDDASP